MRSWGEKHKLKEIAFYFSNFKQTTLPPPKKKKKTGLKEVDTGMWFYKLPLMNV